ncbi:hypothetical protein BMS3Abin11_02072 [bacterium BMS3Abin11]|nr:hypothetical protein BMS3Abin11_02072 [bacterium BMS3Abin11]
MVVSNKSKDNWQRQRRDKNAKTSTLCRTRYWYRDISDMATHEYPQSVDVLAKYSIAVTTDNKLILYSLKITEEIETTLKGLSR